MNDECGAHLPHRPRRLEDEMAWIPRYRQVWDARFAALGGVIDELKREEKAGGWKKRK